MKGQYCHCDIINFACMTWNFVRISASLSALCTKIYLICHWLCISCKILPHFDVRTISVAQKLYKLCPFGPPNYFTVQCHHVHRRYVHHIGREYKPFSTKQKQYFSEYFIVI